MNLFGTIKCDHCGKDVSFDPRNSFFWYGIRDADNGMYVCFDCRNGDYYKWKATTKHAHMYSEVPVILQQ